MSALKCRETAIVPVVAGSDLRDKEGYLTEYDSGTGVMAVNTSATVPAKGVVLEGADTDKVSSIGILGAVEGSVRLKAGGAIAKFDRVQQKNDGTVVTDAGPGNARVVVGVALEAAAAGDLFEAALLAPVIAA